MTTTELTQQFDTLTQPERRQVSNFMAQLVEHRTAHPAMKRYSRAEFVNTILKSHTQIKRGETITHQELLAEIRKDYGLSV